jgi:hypothetical protein
MKRLILFGTRHYTISNVPTQVANALERTIDKLKPNVILEEWSKSQTKESATSAIGRGRNLCWYDIGTPEDGEFATYRINSALDFPGIPTIYRYGPIDAQNKREDMMRANITGYMSSYETALVVIGLGHIHSMYDRLSKEFDVEGYSFANEFF